MSESIKELRKICQDKGFKEKLLYRIYRVFSIYLTKVLLVTKISANQVTALAIIFSFLSMGMIAFGDYPLKVGGGALYLFAFLLDFVDGEIARFQKKCSQVGVWLDGVSHNLVYPLTFFSVGLAVFYHSNNYLFLVLGFIAALSIIIFRLLEVKSTLAEYLNQPKSNLQDQKKDLPKNVYNWKSFLLDITKFYILAPVLLIFILINRLDIFIYFYSFYNFFILLGVLVFQYKQIKKADIQK